MAAATRSTKLRSRTGDAVPIASRSRRRPQLPVRSPAGPSTWREGAATNHAATHESRGQRQHEYRQQVPVLGPDDQRQVEPRLVAESAESEGAPREPPG